MPSYSVNINYELFSLTQIITYKLMGLPQAPHGTIKCKLVHGETGIPLNLHKRVQAVGESVAEFDAALRKLAIHCDQFVCGLQH